jgi:hypothetical protein
MTAIAYRDGIMAADTMGVVDEYVKTLNEAKIMKARGHLIGVSGDHCPDNKAILKWFFGPRKPWPAPVDFTLLVASPYGHIALVDHQGNSTALDKETFWSVGSGRECCMCAMEAGATAKEAVRIAIKRCPTVSGKVTSRTLRGRASKES